MASWTMIKLGGGRKWWAHGEEDSQVNSQFKESGPSDYLAEQNNVAVDRTNTQHNI